jgi:hypothetical protein
LLTNECADREGISTHHHGKQQRMSQRTAVQAWRTFLQDVKVSEEYQLDDDVLTGRVAILRAARVQRLCECG